MSSVQLAQHFANQPKRSSESRTPIIGLSSDESYHRHRHNVNRNTSSLSSLIAIRQYLPSGNKKMNLKSISRKKQFVSEEFTLDSTVDKYSQLDDNDLKSCEFCKPKTLDNEVCKPKSLKKPKSRRRRKRLDDTEKTYETMFIGKEMIDHTIDHTERTELMDDFVFDDGYYHTLEPLAWKAVTTVAKVAEKARDFSPTIYMMVPLFPAKRYQQ